MKKYIFLISILALANSVLAKKINPIEFCLIKIATFNSSIHLSRLEKEFGTSDINKIFILSVKQNGSLEDLEMMLQSASLNLPLLKRYYDRKGLSDLTSTQSVAKLALIYKKLKIIPKIIDIQNISSHHFYQFIKRQKGTPLSKQEANEAKKIKSALVSALLDNYLSAHSLGDHENLFEDFLINLLFHKEKTELSHFPIVKKFVEQHKINLNYQTAYKDTLLSNAIASEDWKSASYLAKHTLIDLNATIRVKVEGKSYRTFSSFYYDPEPVQIYGSYLEIAQYHNAPDFILSLLVP